MTHQPHMHSLSGDLSHSILLELKRRLTAAGCFVTDPRGYSVRIMLITTMYALGYTWLLIAGTLPARLVSALIVAFATVQAGFIAHDVGDGAVTRNPKLALLLQHYLMSYLSALSSRYFTHLHRAHHIRLYRGLGVAGHSSANFNPFEVRTIKKIFAWNGVIFAFATMCLRGLTFKFESLRYVQKYWTRTKLDQTMMILHFLTWFLLPIPFIGFTSAAVNYALILIAGGVYIGAVLVVNHEGMAKVDALEQLSLLERTIATTRNLGSSWLSNILLGGVNNHIEHHLFPQIPVTNLPKARTITESYLRECDVTYVSTSFAQAFGSALRYFRCISPAMRVNQALS